MQELKDHVSAAGATRIEFHCSPYHQHSALYPIIDHLYRLLQFQREDTPEERLRKLENMLKSRGGSQTRPYRAVQEEAPLFAALLSLPHPEGYPPITMSPQKQKEKTQAALVAWLVEEAEQRPVYTVWEDLHWADPSTLEVLALLLDQAPTTRILMVLTCRPEFTSPWGARSYLTQLTLNRLERKLVEAMVERVTGDKILPTEVVQQIVNRTDGVPLFVEELTKAVVEAVGGAHVLHLQLAIPATLQDSLMARLDRLGPAKNLAQLGATLGREFSYELLHAVSNQDEDSLQHGLRQLVETELIYQRGLGPQAHYLFKHALIQDTAYQSLLKSKRQQLHQQIAQVLEERFSNTKEQQPELLAHHYTEAGLIAQAIPYWQRAGERAVRHSAYGEAVSHLKKGLELLKTLPETPERTQQELALQLTLGPTVSAVKGYVAPEAEKAGSRARELCQQLGDSPQLLAALGRLWLLYHHRGELLTAQELAEQRMQLAQSTQDRYALAWAHLGLGMNVFCLGEFASSQTHFEQSIALYDPKIYIRFTGTTAEPRVVHISYASPTLWYLGYPDQSLKRSQESLALAVGLSHPFSLAYALWYVIECHLLRREGRLAQEQAEAMMLVAIEQGFPLWLARGTIVQGLALVEQGQVQEGMAQLHQGLAAHRTIGHELGRPLLLARLVEACGKAGQIEESLRVLSEALVTVEKTGERFYEAELYRLKGELRLQKEFNVQGSTFQALNPQSLTPSTQAKAEAEACFLKALDIARKQQAKSLELRASMSLARLWRQQGKKAQAYDLLSNVYNWFTEGFDTKDLQEAKALLEQLMEYDL